MYKRCRAFPSEYQFEYGKAKHCKPDPIIPKQYWGDEKGGEIASLDGHAKELLIKFASERLQTNYRLDYIDRSKKQEDQEIDLGNELINYLKNMYFNPDTLKPKRLPYTSTRLFGYASSQDSIIPLSNYQDTFGRTGGQVILRNVNKMLAAKRRQMIRSKLQAKPDREISLVFPTNH